MRNDRLAAFPASTGLMAAAAATGLMQAARFPEDYDGILAGAPAAPASVGK